MLMATWCCFKYEILDAEPKHITETFTWAYDNLILIKGFRIGGKVNLIHLELPCINK